MKSEKLKRFKAKRDEIRQRIARLKEHTLATSQKADEMLEFIEEIKESEKPTK